MADFTPIQTKIRVIACGMLVHETIAINEQLGDSCFDLKCLPAEYHNHPEKIAPAVDKAILQAKKEGFESIFVGYADCGTRGELDKVCSRHGIERIQGPHCFSFYMGNETFRKRSSEFTTTFFITDFLARHFESFLVKPLGLDRHPELRELYFSNYERALYLAQTDNPDLDKKAKKAANFLGLEYERRKTGYGNLADVLTKKIK